MKKLYTLALAAIVAASSATAAPARHAHTRHAAKHVAAKPVPAKAIAKAAPAADIAGNYEFVIFDENTSEYVLPTLTIAAGTSADAVTLNIDLTWLGASGSVAVSATYDAETGELTIPAQTAGSYTIGTSTWDFNQGDFLDVESIAAEWNGLCFMFTAEDAISISTASDELVFGDYLSLAVIESDSNEGWTSLGNATFEDGWMLPFFEIDQTDAANQYEVELQQNNANKNLYRLVNPYKGNSPVAEYNEYPYTGYIEFDVTDPEHVVFTPRNAGMRMVDEYLVNFYPMNILSMCVHGFDMSVEESIEFIESQDAGFSTFKDGVLTLPSEFDEATSTWTADAVFGDQDNPFGMFCWDDVATLETKIIFPAEAGISNVEADNSNAPVEYYNLQGMRVAAPAAGQVYIRRQGTEAAKVKF